MDFPQTMIKTRKEMSAIGLPDEYDCEDESQKATIIKDRIIDQRRWTTVHELIFRLPGMPEDLAYRTTYGVGSTESQDERPFEYGDADCTLVRQVEKVIKVWESAQASKS